MFNAMESLILAIADRIVAAILIAPGIDKTIPYSARAAQYIKMLDDKPAFECEKPFRDIWGEVNFLARFEKFTWVVGETFKARMQVRNLTGRVIPEGTAFPCTPFHPFPW